MATEKRLISLDEAIAKIKDDGLLGSGYSDDERMDDVIDILESCHIVDAVPVVRCKDCRWFNAKKLQYRGICDHPTTGILVPEENDFCSYGERKDNG